jgi:hypothetical protein
MSVGPYRTQEGAGSSPASSRSRRPFGKAFQLRLWPHPPIRGRLGCEIGVRSIHKQAAQRRGANRTDGARPVLETARYEEATADHRTRPRGVAPRALRRDVWDRGRLMFPMAVALPLALLPIVSLAATLRWMAVSSA